MSSGDFETELDQRLSAAGFFVTAAAAAAAASATAQQHKAEEGPTQSSAAGGGPGGSSGRDIAGALVGLGAAAAAVGYAVKAYSARKAMTAPGYDIIGDNGGIGAGGEEQAAAGDEGEDALAEHRRTFDQDSTV